MIGSQSVFVVDVVDIPDYSLVMPCGNFTQYTRFSHLGYRIAAETRTSNM